MLTELSLNFLEEGSPYSMTVKLNRFGFITLLILLLTLRLLISYIYGAPSKARNTNVVYIWTYVWQR